MLLVEGLDYFHYKCSECDADIVTLRKFTYPIQCNHICKEIYRDKILKSRGLAKTGKSNE